jgi:glycosyltransferase involved in cell wall biosynthesis
MRANLRLKRQGLAGADAVIAVSRKMAELLHERAPELSATRIETIPNAVDITAIRTAAQSTIRPMEHPYALFVGKLARNKGVDSIIEIASRAHLDMPLVVIGDGAGRSALAEAAARAKLDIQLLGWLDREDVFRWLRHACLLIFPSGWLEPLSRVLIEASALGVPIAATNTGGTSDILVHEETGLLGRSDDELAGEVTRLAADRTLRERLGAAAQKFAASQFDTPVIVGRMEQLYADVIERFQGAHHAT